MRRVLVVLLLASGCRHAVNLERAPGAPELPPSTMTEQVASPPAGAQLLGTIRVQSNNMQTGQDCEAKALYDAKRIGATHVVIRPEKSTMGRGPKCRADAYYVAPK